jgi:hypothetical protein
MDIETWDEFGMLIGDRASFDPLAVLTSSDDPGGVRHGSSARTDLARRSPGRRQSVSDRDA